jgi:FkbM family methyltransferase
MSNRQSSLKHALAIAKYIKPESLRTIIDIGAQYETDFLAEICPESYHYLIEPCSHYHARLSHYYKSRNINHEIIRCPMYSEKIKLFLHKVSQDQSGNITHTSLKSEVDKELQFLLEIEELTCQTIDSFISKRKEKVKPLEYLIKIDVDGNDDEIIKGGQNSIKDASFVIIENSVGNTETFINRLKSIADLGFDIYDICDNAYYYNQLSLVDIMLINKKLKSSEIKFKPWNYSGNKVVWDQWRRIAQNPPTLEIKF